MFVNIFAYFNTFAYAQIWSSFHIQGLVQYKDDILPVYEIPLLR